MDKWEIRWSISRPQKEHFLLRLTLYLMQRQVQHSNIVHSARTVFICFLFISEKKSEFCSTKQELVGFYNRN
jgi:hypothetical protein